MAGDRVSKRLNRRDFIKLTSLAAAGAYVGVTSDAARAMGGGGGGMGGGGTGIIDPPIGAPLADPASLPLTRTAPGVLAGTIEPMVSRVPINGSFADLMTNNGAFPGPVVRLTKGDKFALKFVNGLPTHSGANVLGYERGVTNIHTHGWHVSPSGMMDDVMRHFMPGEQGDYLYDLSLQEAGTLCWYHPHIHGLTAEQVWGGLHGPLVIEDETTLLSGLETHILVLKDITVSSGAPAPYSSTMEYMQGKEGATIMVNGQVNPVLSMRPGQVQRWRLLNASTARLYKISLQGHSLRVIGTDGGLLDKPYAQSAVLLAPGKRLDVLVKASATKGLYKFLALPYARHGSMQSPQITLMTANVSGTATSGSIPSAINPDANRLAVDLSKWPQRAFALSMSRGPRLHQRPGLRRHAVYGRLGSDARHGRDAGDGYVRGLDDQQPVGHGPPMAPAREPGPGALDQRR